MRNVDTSIYSAEKLSRIKPDDIDLSDLPRIEKPSPPPSASPSASPLFVFQPDEPSRTEKPPHTERKTVRNTVRSENRSEKRTEFRAENRTDSLPIKRKTKRYSFEFYDDQLTRLKRLKYQVEGTGESVTLSDMVREAVDTYLHDKGL